MPIVSEVLATKPLRVGLIGHGRAGQAVARALMAHPLTDLRWVVRQRPADNTVGDGAAQAVPIMSVADQGHEQLLEQQPVDAIVDFSSAQALAQYADAVESRGLMLVTAVSHYDELRQARLRNLGARCRVVASPNITLGINFLMVAARMLRSMAPFADVRIIEEHFKEKPEISGTAMRLAQSLSLNDESITSLRLGGIVGHHEVIFGFPHQTVRLSHDAIRREAFGTGAIFALEQLRHRPPGFYSMEDLVAGVMSQQFHAA